MKKLITAILLIVLTVGLTSCGDKYDLTGLALYLPTKDDVEGWEMSEQPRFFQADNLWEYINGGADAYLVYGFKEVVTVAYKSKDFESDMLVDIFQMADPVNAFGIYSSERSPDYNYIDMGTEGYLSGTSLNFWKGSYYVKIVCHQESDALKEEMKKFAEATAAKITETSETPEPVSIFPEEGLIDKSVRYIAKDVLGQTFFTNGYTADYTIDGNDLKAFLVYLPDEETAKTSFESYKEFITESGEFWPNTTRKLQKRSGLGDEVFIGKDSFYGFSIVFWKGSVVGGVFGIEKTADGEKFVKKIIPKL